jgi:hypothetical protein
MSDIYKFAAQTTLRFPSKRGELTVEQLFQLPLKSQTGFDLDTVARTVNDQLKSVSEESFVEDTTADPRKQALVVALDIVKDVIATKQCENRAAAARSQRAVERKKLLDAIAAKKDANLSQASLEELEKQLTALDG